MINHSCRPNCVKLTFEGSSASFVFATEPIEANCEIFVSYLGAEYSHLYRATTLREQHWFEIEGSDGTLMFKIFCLCFYIFEQICCRKLLVLCLRLSVSLMMVCL
jgi:hypothetical protein